MKIRPERVTDDLWQSLLESFSLKTLKDLHIEIGRGRMLPYVIAQALFERLGEQPIKKSTRKKNLRLSGDSSTLLRYAECCRPLPHEAIIGWMRPELGLEVHARDCVVLKQQTPPYNALIDVTWPPDDDARYASEIVLWAKERQGLLADLATAIANADTNISQVWLDRSIPQEPIAIRFLLDVRNRQHLAEILRALRRVSGVRKVQRARKTS